MNSFKNVVLQKEHKDVMVAAINLGKGDVGGCSIEIETDNPIAFESYLYKGKTAESDRNHDFEILKKMFKKPTN